MKQLRTVICGGNSGESWHFARACKNYEGIALSGFLNDDAAAAKVRAGENGTSPHADFESVLKDKNTDAVILLAPLTRRTEMALKALSAGKHVLIGTPFGDDSQQAAKLASAAKGASTVLACAAPLPCYPPFRKLISLAEKKVTGRPSSIRLRSLIAGKGGWDTYLNPDSGSAAAPCKHDSDETLKKEIFDKLYAARVLLGPISEIFLVHSFVGEKGSAALIWKHTRPATYGALDIILAPDMEIRSAYDSRDDNIELTGGTGLIWLTKGASQMKHEPTLRIYRGENQFAYGNLDDDWQSAYNNCIKNFTECVSAGRTPLFDAGLAAEISGYTESALKSGASQTRMKTATT